jgi:glycosyltransferase involved in cell wall biosynthesis
MAAVAERQLRPGIPVLESAERPVRLLTLTTLFPSAARPRHGIFVETRLRRLLATNAVSATVVAPVPWFPSGAGVFGEYGVLARTPRAERRDGIQVVHPRYFMLPKVGMAIQPGALAWTAGREIARLERGGLQFDLIDAHYFYPDGVAAAIVARRLGKPFVVTARGSDINHIARLEGPRRRIVAAAQAAGRVIAVSRALKDAMVELGIDPDRIVVLRNGVDLELFRPVDRAEARRALDLTAAKVAVSVGNLVPEKGHELFIEALASLPGVAGLIVGGGPEHGRLSELIRRRGVASRIRIVDEMPQERLRTVYSAADALVLASSREGWPNVLLEAMACGTPVVAAAVGGVREIVSEPVAGRVLESPDGAAIAAALTRLLAAPPDRLAVRGHAERFGWDEVVRGQLDVFQTVLAGAAAC